MVTHTQIFCDLQELAQLDGQVCDTNILLQMDNSRDLDIDCIIKNVEAWYLSVAQRSKEEVNALYENRVSCCSARDVSCMCLC